MLDWKMWSIHPYVSLILIIATPQYINNMVFGGNNTLAQLNSNLNNAGIIQ